MVRLISKIQLDIEICIVNRKKELRVVFSIFFSFFSSLTYNKQKQLRTF